MPIHEQTEIRDVSLAPSGRDKIAWVVPGMPVLRAVERRFAAELGDRIIRRAVDEDYGIFHKDVPLFIIMPYSTTRAARHTIA